MIPSAARPRQLYAASEASSRGATAMQEPVGASAWVLMDADSGMVLAEHNAHRKMFPASTTKTMTALIAISQSELDRVVRIGPNPPQTGEQSINLLEGEKFTLRDLVRAAMIKSANDSCVAIAEGVAGSVPAFARLMNEEAKRLGARDTHFANPHGLHDPNHYTTPYDLALIAREAMRYPFFNQIIKTRHTVIHGNYKIGKYRSLTNKNKLLWHWGETDGVKTGYTRQAGNCLIASATRWVKMPSGERRRFRLISVVMHSPSSFNDCAQLLLHQGFERFQPVTVVQANQEFGVADVTGGAFSAKAVTPRTVNLPLRRDELSQLSSEPHFLGLTAPIKRGQPVGYLQFQAGTRTLAKLPLVAQEAVPASVMARVLPPMASVMPSYPPLRWGIYGGTCLIIALLLSALRVWANGKSKRKRKRWAQSSRQRRREPAGFDVPIGEPPTRARRANRTEQWHDSVSHAASVAAARRAQTEEARQRVEEWRRRAEAGERRHRQHTS
jgi:D-alanyl-D-alanine carboxypeptidase (penicillin-binding protein 5/6)